MNYYPSLSLYVHNIVAQYFIAEIDEGLSCNWIWKLRCVPAFPALIYDSIPKCNNNIVSSRLGNSHQAGGQLILRRCSWYLLVRNPERSWLSGSKQLVKLGRLISLYLSRPDLRISLQPTTGNGGGWGRVGETALRALFCSLKSCHEQPS